MYCLLESLLLPLPEPRLNSESSADRLGAISRRLLLGFAPGPRDLFSRYLAAAAMSRAADPPSSYLVTTRRQLHRRRCAREPRTASARGPPHCGGPNFIGTPWNPTRKPPCAYSPPVGISSGLLAVHTTGARREQQQASRLFYRKSNCTVPVTWLAQIGRLGAQICCKNVAEN